MKIKFEGLPASPGIAIGPLWVYQSFEPEAARTTVEDVNAEISRFEAVKAQAADQLKELEEKARREIGDEEAAIFEAHQMFLEDPALIRPIISAINDEAINAEIAVETSVEEVAKQLEGLDDPYFQARAADVRDVGRRLVKLLMGVDTMVDNFPDDPVVVFADDLTPSDTVQFDRSKILGFVTVRGGPTSHTAILACSMGIPAVVCLPVKLDQLMGNEQVVLDGRTGEVLVDPDEDALTHALTAQKSWRKKAAQDLSESHKQAVTLDGHAVEIVANIGDLSDAEQALIYGAEGVGLFRTEFLYLDRNTLPNEDEQVAAYKKIFDVMAGKPVVVRTLDIGGDKEVPYLGFKDEANPFLGWRAFRMANEREDVFYSQFRALLRAGVDTDLRIMVPMISRLMEVENARNLLKKAESSLKEEGIPYAQTIQFGIMIEIPSVVLIAKHIAPLVDFFSIGTNDLTLYTMAVDRTNERVAAIASPFHPSVIRLINMTIEAAHEHGKWVGLCGEFAANPLAAHLLLGLGLDEFSMSPVAIPEIKALLRRFSLKECKEIADKTLRLSKTETVKAYLQTVLEEKEFSS